MRMGNMLPFTLEWTHGKQGYLTLLCDTWAMLSLVPRGESHVVLTLALWKEDTLHSTPNTTVKDRLYSHVLAVPIRVNAKAWLCHLVFALENAHPAWQCTLCGACKASCKCLPWEADRAVVFGAMLPHHLADAISIQQSTRVCARDCQSRVGCGDFFYP